MATKRKVKKSNVKRVSKVKRVSNIVHPVDFFKQIDAARDRKRKHTEILETITYSDRVDDEDLYKYFDRKRFNARVKKFQKENPGKVIVATVEITLGNTKIKNIRRRGRIFFIRGNSEFKLTKFKSVDFIGGNRKGKKYTAKDQLAYFIHDRINQEDWTLYRRTTDTNEIVKQYGKPKRHSKKQSFKVTIQAVNPKSAKSVQSVATTFEDLGIKRNKKRARRIE